MVTVKLSTPWPHNYYRQSLNGKGIFEDYKFEINNECDDCDWWIIWGGITKEEEVKVNEERIIYITDEVHEQRSFNSKFLKQFKLVASVRKDLNVNKIVPISEIAPWYFDKSYNDLLALQPPVKSKGISVISSDLTWLPGHKKRFAFVNKLIGHFKDKLDVFGRGFNEIEDKYDTLINYKYSVAIENNSVEGYFTEKISECFLTYTMPVYYGAPDINNYYDERSFLNINIDNYKDAFQKIEELLYIDPYPTNLPFIVDSRKKYLETYHVFPAIIRLIQRVKKTQGENVFPKKVKIVPEKFFLGISDEVLSVNGDEMGVRRSGILFLKNLLRKFK